MQKVKALFVGVLLLFVLHLGVLGQQPEVERVGFVRGARLDAIKASYVILQPIDNGSTLNKRLGFMAWWEGASVNTANTIVSVDGGRLMFSSMISLLNFMAFNGWELVGKIDDLSVFPPPAAKGLLFKKKQ